jgi:retinol dehydrogenase-12
MAWGRVAPLPDDIYKALKNEAEGGSGVAQTFWDYCDRETKSFR